MAIGDFKYPLVIYLVTKEGRLLLPTKFYDMRCLSGAISDIDDYIFGPESPEVKSLLFVKQKCCIGEDGLSMVEAYAYSFLKGEKMADDRNEYLEIEL